MQPARGLDLSIADVSPVTWDDLTEDALRQEDSVGPQDLPDLPQPPHSGGGCCSDCVNCDCHT